MAQEISQINAMRGTLNKLSPELAMVLPANISPEKFIRTTMTAIQMNPSLLTVDRKNLLSACMKSAQDGLLPDGREAVLNIFHSKKGPMIQYMPMIGGILKKLRNSGDLESISANVVYSNDFFEYELGDSERIVHKPTMADPGNPVAAYAIAKTREGGIYREVMSFADIEKVRAYSKAQSGPWFTFWGEMAKKTVIRRLAKRLPSSSDVDQVFERDNEQYDFNGSQGSRDTPGPGGAGIRGIPETRLENAMGLERVQEEEVEVEIDAPAPELTNEQFFYQEKE